MSTTVITGANRGIGLELARQLRARGDDVIALGRRSSPELEATGARIETDIDVGKDDVVEEIARRLSGVQVDWIIHNAGILPRQGFDNLTFDAMRDCFEVNTLGPLRVVKALHENVREGGKIGLVSSRVGSIDDNGSGGSYPYRVSKTALNMIGKNLSHEFKQRQIAVALLHPGWVRTEMTGGTGNADPDEAAAGLIARMDELDMERTGTFWHANGEQLPW